MAACGTRWWRSRIARFVALIFLSQIVISGTALLLVLKTAESSIEQDHREWVSSLRSDMLEAQRLGGRRALVNEINRWLNGEGADLAILLLTDRDGHPIAGNLDRWPSGLPQQTDWRRASLQRSNGQSPEQVLFVATLMPNGTRLLTGRAVQLNGNVVRQYEKAAALGVAMIVIWAMVITLLMGRLLSRRLALVVETAEAVADGVLSRRVATDGSHDAFDRLGFAINAMLDRIDRLVSDLRLATDGLSHDLKSPLTRLTTTLAQMRSDGSPAEIEAGLARAALECLQLEQMLSMSLLISRTDGGVGREHFGPVDMREMLEGLAELYQPLAEDKGIAIDIAAPAGLTATVNRQLLEQAIGNLIDNAISYALGATRITMAASAHAGMILIAVADDGPGIAAEQREQALKRFGRLDPARSLPGSGLGLSLVTAVARLHGGTVDLGHNAPGLRVTMSIMA